MLVYQELDKINWMFKMPHMEINILQDMRTFFLFNTVSVEEKNSGTDHQIYAKTI